jgi:putative transposase
VGLIREAVQLVLQELIETEATEHVGADRYERSDSRITDRNGHRPRLLATQAGDVELRIPKLRKGSFFPSILEPRRRIDRALYAVVWRPTSPACRPALSTTSSLRLGLTRGSPSRRCRGSVLVSMRSSAPSAPAAELNSGG